jgi:hypothetical protein
VSRSIHKPHRSIARKRGGRFRRCWRRDVVLDAINGLERVRESVNLRGNAARNNACFGSSGSSWRTDSLQERNRYRCAPADTHRNWSLGHAVLTGIKGQIDETRSLDRLSEFAGTRNRRTSRSLVLRGRQLQVLSFCGMCSVWRLLRREELLRNLLQDRS